MFKLPVKVVLSLGLTIFLVGLLLLAAEFKIIANPDEMALSSRAQFCETVAISASLFVREGNTDSAQLLLQSIVDRAPELLSAGVRRDLGKRLLAATPTHRDEWAKESEFLQETHIAVPIFSGSNQPWGQVEIVYTPISKAGLTGLFENQTIRLVCFVGVLSFITSYLYLARMLKVMNSRSVPQRVRTALNTLAGGLIVADAKGDIVLANDAVCNWVGIAPDELMGHSVSELPWKRSVDEVGVEEELPWMVTFDAQVPIAGSMLKIDAVDGERALIANASPMIGNEGELRGVFIGLEDVTVLEQKKVEHEQLRAEAERANSAKSDFLARMSHEIRTPMNAILGFTDVLRRGFDQDVREREEYLNTIHSSGEHLLSLINDILDLSKVESGRMELESTQCSPHKIILETLQVLQVKADQKGLELTYEPTNGVPEFIYGDPVRLRQIVTNLVGNAIKFTENGGVRVKTQLIDRVFEIRIVDSGIGISKEAQARIFEPFSQADNSVTRKFGGTGLGLAIAKKFAEAMHGGIRVESEQGTGTQFIVTVSPGSLDGIRRINVEEALQAREVRTGTTLDANLPDCKILVVDDGSSNRKLLRLFLQRAGASIVEAENGLEAFELTAQEEFDLVLMDMQMPVMDGYTASAEIRKRGDTIPIVALTAHAMKEDEAKCLAAGCSHFLTKPIDSNKLLQLMSDILGGETRPVEKSERITSQEKNAEASEHAAVTNEASQTQSEPPTQSVASPTDASPTAPASDSPINSDAVASVQASVEKIRSTLPTDDVDFLEIVEEFVERLYQQLDAMDAAFADEDYEGLSRLAHWLKGSGGTAGFHQFTDPARNLEVLAKSNDATSVPAAIGSLRSLADRIET